MHSILEARDADGRFTDIFEFAGRVDPKHANRRVFEAFVKSGALDSLEGNRAQQLDAIDGALDLAAAHARERELGQVSLFGESSGTQKIVPKLRNLAPPQTMEMLGWERDTLGVFLSGHPLADIAEALQRSGAINIRDAKTRTEEEVVTIAGLLTHVRRTLTRAQSQMLIATLEDMSGSIECVVYPKLYDDLQAPFVQDHIVVISGRVRVPERPGNAAPTDAPPEATMQVSTVTPFTPPPASRCPRVGIFQSDGANRSMRSPRCARNFPDRSPWYCMSGPNRGASSAESRGARAFEGARANLWSSERYRRST